MLVYLRRPDSKMDALQADVREFKHRMTTVEVQVTALAATEASHYASLAERMDRFEARMDRMERRQDLIPTP